MSRVSKFVKLPAILVVALAAILAVGYVLGFFEQGEAVNMFRVSAFIVVIVAASALLMLFIYKPRSKKKKDGML